MSLGQRIRKRRDTLGITQQVLAEALKVTPQHISAIEQDKRIPSLRFLIKLGEQLGVSIDYLAVGKESVVTDTIPAIKADKSLPLAVKRALIVLVETFRSSFVSEALVTPSGDCPQAQTKEDVTH